MRSIPVLSETAFPPPKEQMLATRADFLLAYFEADDADDTEGATGLATLEQLDAAGIEVYTVRCSRDGDDTTIELRDLGKIFGVSERAEQVIRR